MDGHETGEPVTGDGAERSGVSRRGFLVGAAGLTGVAVSGVWRSASARAADTTASATSSAGLVFLELQGKLVGSVKLVDGGSPVAEVVDEPRGGDGIVRKHIGGVKYEDFTVQVGMGMGKPVYDWISSFMDGKVVPKNGAFIGVDSGLKVRRRTEFSNALITEIGFPASDAASKDPAFLTLKIAPESTSTKPGDNSTIGGSPSSQKLWLPANFRLTVGGLDTATVVKVEAYPVKWEIGTDRQAEPGKLEFPNVKISFAEARAKSWYDWFDDFVIKGNNGEESELFGLLEWLTPDLSRVLASVDISQVGIVGIAPDRPQPSAGVRRVTVEMYCEQMHFNFRPTGT